MRIPNTSYYGAWRCALVRCFFVKDVRFQLRCTTWIQIFFIGIWISSCLREFASCASRARSKILIKHPYHPYHLFLREIIDRIGGTSRYENIKRIVLLNGYEILIDLSTFADLLTLVLFFIGISIMKFRCSVHLSRWVSQKLFSEKFHTAIYFHSRNIFIWETRSGNRSCALVITTCLSFLSVFSRGISLIQ